jgi:hypothetical protein
MVLVCMSVLQLFALCTGMFPPSEEFSNYLCSYFFRQAECGGVVAEFARYCLGRLDRTMADGARKKPPTALEVDAVQERRPITIRVRFLDDTCTFQVNVWDCASRKASFCTIYVVCVCV